MIARPWVVSVLSTAYDLEEYRKAIICLLKQKEFVVSAYEESEFPVEADLHSHDSCLVALKRADMAIVIIDKRSGGTYYGIEDDTKKISITQAEYLEAINSDIPIYTFVNRNAFNELHAYKKGFKAFCQENKYTSKKAREIKKYQDQYDKSYICTYVEKVQTLHFINSIQNAYKDYNISNWMDFFTNIDEFIKAVEGKLVGYSRMLVHRLAKSQKVALLNKHTSTAFGMSLGDVFESEYYIEPPHQIVSGQLNLTVKNNVLSDEIKNVLCSDNSILIYGEAGYGKTTILAKCFSDHIKNLNNNPSYDVPLFLTLRNKGNAYHFDVEKYIEEELAAAEDASLRHKKYPYLDLSQLRMRFYCDGFDEIAETLSKDDLDKICNSSIFLYPLVLTCRQQYILRYLDELNFSDKFGVRIQMGKWSIETARDYINNFCSRKQISDQDKESIFTVIGENSDLQQVLDSPLLITMFLWFIENQRSRVINHDISRVELFENWLEALSKRELSKSNIKGISEDIILKVWEKTAWEIYINRVHSERLRIDDHLEMLNEQFPKIGKDNILSCFDALFDCTREYISGTFHEQFMEYLVARLLVFACEKGTNPYPDFLKLVLRPEINRYFRGIYREKSRFIQASIYKAIYSQYFDNVGKGDDVSIAIRVHAIYHLCRLESSEQKECIERAFNVERHISVLLSLYFGAIKLGRMDIEKDFCERLQKETNYSIANRGYHLAYYADFIGGVKLPYTDDNKSNWQGTLRAFERHFESDELGHFFLRRIDLVTMIQLIEARKSVIPLTKERLMYFGERIRESKYEKSNEYSSYNVSIVNEYENLKKVFSTYSEEQVQ